MRYPRKKGSGNDGSAWTAPVSVPLPPRPAAPERPAMPKRPAIPGRPNTNAGGAAQPVSPAPRSDAPVSRPAAPVSRPVAPTPRPRTGARPAAPRTTTPARSGTRRPLAMGTRATPVQAPAPAAPDPSPARPTTAAPASDGVGAAKDKGEDSYVAAKLLTIPYAAGVVVAVGLVVVFLVNQLLPVRLAGLYWVLIHWLNGIAAIVVRSFPSAAYSVAYLQENPNLSNEFEGYELSPVVFGSVPGMSILLGEVLAVYVGACLVPAIIVCVARKRAFPQAWLDCMAWPGALWSGTSFMVCAPLAGVMSVATGVLLCVACVFCLPVAVLMGMLASPVKFWGNQYGAGVLSGGDGIFIGIFLVLAAILGLLALLAGIVAVLSWFLAVLPVSLLVVVWMASTEAMQTQAKLGGVVPMWFVEWVGCTILLSLPFIVAPRVMGYKFVPRLPRFTARERCANWEGWPISSSGTIDDPTMKWANRLASTEKLGYPATIALAIMFWKSADAAPHDLVNGFIPMTRLGQLLLGTAIIPALIIWVVLQLARPPRIKALTGKTPRFAGVSLTWRARAIILCLGMPAGMTVVLTILSGGGTIMPFFALLLYATAIILAVLGVVRGVREYTAAKRWSTLTANLLTAYQNGETTVQYLYEHQSNQPSTPRP